MTIIKSKSIENNTIFKTDICIIGSGMSAQIIASSLKNKKLILVESGKISYDKSIQNLNHFETKGLKFRENHKNRIRQLGGSANLWANQLMYLDKEDIEKRDWVINEFAWPISYKELNSYYEKILNLLFEINIKKKFFLNEFPKKYFDSKIYNCFCNDDIFSYSNHFWPSNVENFNLKSNFTRNLLKLKNVRFIENFTCTNLNIIDGTNKIGSVDIQTDSKNCKIESKIFILACGALENARIILNNEKKSKLFNNLNTGRYFMDHPRKNLGFLKLKKKIDINSFYGIKNLNNEIKTSIKLSAKSIKENKLLNSHCYIDPKLSSEDLIFFENVMNCIKNLVKFKNFNKLNLKMFNLNKISQLIYFFLPKQVSYSFLNAFILNYFKIIKPNFIFDELDLNLQSEQFPNYASKVYLSNNVDEYKQNTLIVDWQLHELDFRSINMFQSLIKAKIKNSNLFSYHEPKNHEVTDASHHSGTTRISKNKKDGVVDLNCKFHDIDNLFISGSSTFRVSGSANPGLTNLAMSLRLADHINKLYV